MKLLQFVTVFDAGGTERQAINLGLGLDPSRFDVHFACLAKRGGFLEQVEASGRPLAAYPVERVHSANGVRWQLQFARDLRRARIQVVHTYGFKVNLFAIPAARLAGTPVVVAGIRDTCDHLSPALRRVQRLVCALADAVVVNAEAIRRQLVQDGYDPTRIVVVPNGIDFGRLRRRHPPGHVRRDLGLPPEAPLVAVFARVDPVKGIEYFLEAAANVTARRPKTRFLIVGGGDTLQDGVGVEAYKQGLQRYARQLGLEGRVIFTGFRPDVPELLSEVAVSVLPSLHEGLSNSLLEAMGAGVPVVATAVGGSPEIVRDGATGLLVPPRDAAALARAIVQVLDDHELAGRLGAAARQHVSERFSIEEMVRRQERLYLELLARRRSGDRRPRASVAASLLADDRLMVRR